MKTAWILLLMLIHSSHSALECNDNDDCLCISGIEYEFQCPDPYQGDGKLRGLLIHAKKEDEFKIECSSSNLDEILLPNITLDAIKYFVIQDCPVPETSFKHILDRLGAKVSNLFKFSRANLSNTILTKEDFVGFENLPGLKLNNNHLVDVDEDVFANTPNLVSLELENNKLKLKKDHFKYTPLLKFLDLSGNSLTEIPVGVFEFLTKLEKLHLWNNLITELNEETFSGLFGLKSLELSANQIQNISEKTLAHLGSLEQINLSLNQIEFLPANLFANNRKLNLIRLKNNRIQLVLPEGLFANLPLLKEIDLSNSGIGSIPENIFQNSTNLTAISMSKSNLSDLPQNIFAGLINLEVIDLTHNRLANISHLFASLKNLKKLVLAHNSITEIKETALIDLQHLEEIDLSNNQIKSIYDFAFNNNINLKKIDLSHNLFSSNNSYPILEPVVNAEEIDLSYNLITEINAVITLINKVHLRKLNLSQNRIQRLSMYDIVPVSNSKVTIDLQMNQISSVDFEGMGMYLEQNDLSARSIKSDAPHAEVYLDYNPINCDCLNFDLVQFFTASTDQVPPQTRVIFDLHADRLSCVSPPELKNMLVKEMDSFLLMCPLEQLETNSSCPENCSCDWSPQEKLVLVDCKKKNFDAYPELSFNLSPKYPVEQIALHLEENNLVAGPSENITGYEMVTSLYLSHNKIRSISWIPEQIKVLFLDNNNLTHLEYQFLDRLNAINFTQLVLKNNLWDCNCEAYNLTLFLKDHYSHIDAKKVFCSNTLVPLSNMNRSDLCSEWQIVYAVLFVTAVLLLAAVLFAVYYRYREIIDAWLYIHGFCRRCIRRKEDQNKLYDAFLSYSHKDEKFVNETLLAVLESGANPFKICVHWRDFVPGEFIIEQVTNNILDSRRTLVVLSPNYLESVWGKMEFRTAHTQAMTDGEARVILILYGDIDIEKLDPELKLYMKTNTYIKWGDPNFWTRLIYALPHKDRNVQTRQRHANVMNFIDEKFNFANGSPVNCSPGTTPPVLTLDPNHLKSHPLNFVPSTQTPPVESGALLTTVTA